MKARKLIREARRQIKRSDRYLYKVKHLHHEMMAHGITDDQLAESENYLRKAEYRTALAQIALSNAQEVR